jgi:hypothetical protein
MYSNLLRLSENFVSCSINIFSLIKANNLENYNYKNVFMPLMTYTTSALDKFDLKPGLSRINRIMQMRRTDNTALENI